MSVVTGDAVLDVVKYANYNAAGAVTGWIYGNNATRSLSYARTAG